MMTTIIKQIEKKPWLSLVVFPLCDLESYLVASVNRLRTLNLNINPLCEQQYSIYLPSNLRRPEFNDAKTFVSIEDIYHSLTVTPLNLSSGKNAFVNYRNHRRLQFFHDYKQSRIIQNPGVKARWSLLLDLHRRTPSNTSTSHNQSSPRGKFSLEYIVYALMLPKVPPFLSQQPKRTRREISTNISRLSFYR